MQTKIAIFILLLFLTGCFVNRIKYKNSDVGNEMEVSKAEEKEILKSNLTVHSFFIQKAEVEVNKGADKENFIASIKFRIPDTFLISIRTSSGIEAARIFLTRDTIVINDRINRTVFYGSEHSMKKKYGFTGRILPVFFGDVIINEDNNGPFNCENNETNVKSIVDGRQLDYRLKCSNRKPIDLSVMTDNESKIIKYEYLDYGMNNDIVSLKKLLISGLADYESIKIKYGKLKVPWNGKIEFIPGKNYPLVEIK